MTTLMGLVKKLLEMEAPGVPLLTYCFAATLPWMALPLQVLGKHIGLLALLHRCKGIDRTYHDAGRWWFCGFIHRGWG